MGTRTRSITFLNISFSLFLAILLSIFQVIKMEGFCCEATASFMLMDLRSYQDKNMSKFIHCYEGDSNLKTFRFAQVFFPQFVLVVILFLSSYNSFLSNLFVLPKEYSIYRCSIYAAGLFHMHTEVVY